MPTAEDKRILRDLARRVDDIARSPEQEKKREMWRRTYVSFGRQAARIRSPEGSWEEILPPSALRCADPAARELEAELRKRLFRFESIRDDTPIERGYDIPVSWIPINEGWGVIPERVASSDKRGSWRYKPVVEDASDWKKSEKTFAGRRRKGRKGKTGGFAGRGRRSSRYPRVTGVKIFDFHSGAHILRFPRVGKHAVRPRARTGDGQRRVCVSDGGFEGLLRQIAQMNLVSLNNDHTYHYTGGVGYTYDLPKKDGFDPSRVRFEDVWGAAEAQEFSCVSPEMHAETVLPFERRLLEPFGLNGYGCCDA